MQMRTRRLPSGVAYDEGAAYIHGTIGNPVVDLMEEAGISLKQVGSSRDTYAPLSEAVE